MAEPGSPAAALARPAGNAFAVGAAAMATLLAIAPFVGLYPVFVMKAMCFALFACAFNLLLGFGGLLSFGHAMFLGTAGYVCAYAAKAWGFNPELAILLGTAASALLGMFNADVFIEGEGWGLMAYGVSLRQQYRRAADLAARLLEGAKPSELPVEFPTRYELVVNLRAAEEYAIVPPREFRARADRVIQ